MITIGVTGGVGSGKSEILRCLNERYSCMILMSDDAAKELELPGRALYGPLVELLLQYGGEEENGQPLLLEDGSISKPVMAARIFRDPELLQKVNKTVHPVVNQYILDEIDRERAAGEKEFFILESALLVENGYDKILDSMWYVYCRESVRYERLRTSRGYSDEKIRSMIGRQVPEETFRSHCDVVIDNTGGLYEPGGAVEQIDAAIGKLRERMAAEGRS